MFLPRQAGFANPASRVTFVSDAELRGGALDFVFRSRASQHWRSSCPERLTVVNRSRRSRVWFTTVDRVLWGLHLTTGRGRGRFASAYVVAIDFSNITEMPRSAQSFVIAKRAGFTWILAKPIDPTELVAAVKALPKRFGLASRSGAP
jgi:hypothetical protein